MIFFPGDINPTVNLSLLQNKFAPSYPYPCYYCEIRYKCPYRYAFGERFPSDSFFNLSIGISFKLLTLLR